MNIVIIDAQGGGVGKQLVEQLKHTLPQQKLIAVGTNALATAAMTSIAAKKNRNSMTVRITAKEPTCESFKIRCRSARSRSRPLCCFWAGRSCRHSIPCGFYHAFTCPAQSSFVSAQPFFFWLIGSFRPSSG